jgi:hypothetical protein
MIRTAVVAGLVQVVGGSGTALLLSVLPYGIDTDNSTLVDFWTAQPVIPTSRVTLQVRVNVGSEFEQVLQSRPELSVDKDAWLALKIGGDLDQAIEYRMLLAPAFSVNIGASGPMNIQASLTYGDDFIAATSVEFEIGPLGSEFCPHSCLVGATAILSEQQQLDENAPPPVCMPLDLVDAYTMGGLSTVRSFYFDDKTNREDKTYPIYSRGEIESFVDKARKRQEYYYGYTDTFLYAALDRHPIRGKNVLLIGSNVPWYESIWYVIPAVRCLSS